MICKKCCGIFIVIIIAMIYFTIMTPTEKHKTLHRLLTMHQKEAYKKIVHERRSIYYQGYLLGFILSMLIIYNSPKMKQNSMICLVGVVSFTVNYFYYILSPKSDWIILHLYSAQQRLAWLDVYKSMQFNYHMGFLLGIIGMMVLTKGIY